MRLRPAAPVSPPGELDLNVIRTEAAKVLWDSQGEFPTDAKISLFTFMAAILVLGFRSIQDGREIRRLKGRLAAIERVPQPPLK